MLCYIYLLYNIIIVMVKIFRIFYFPNSEYNSIGGYYINNIEFIKQYTKAKDLYSIADPKIINFYKNLFIKYELYHIQQYYRDIPL